MRRDFPQTSRGDVVKRPLAIEPGRAAFDTLPLCRQRSALWRGEYLAPPFIHAPVRRMNLDDKGSTIRS